MKLVSSLLIATLAFLVAWPAAAYVGPGAGLSLLGALWAVVAAIGLALLFVVIWPVRRLLKRRNVARRDASSEGGTRDEPSTPHQSGAPR